MKNFLKYMIAITLLCGVMIFLYALLIEPNRLVVTEYNVQTEKWNHPKPLRIALLADMHAIEPWMDEDHLDEIVRRANELEPDVILLLGDYIALHPFGKSMQPDVGVRPYKYLKAACGVFAIVGNHDLLPNSGWPEALAKTGIPVMRNQVKKVECHGQSFWVAGLDEWWLGRPDITKVMTSIQNKDPVIFMTHNPDAFVEVPVSVALSVAGHTHGGQLRFPFIGSIAAVVPSIYGSKYDRGHFIEDGKDLVVSSGLGMTGIPLRLLNPPEITLVTLRSAN